MATSSETVKRIRTELGVDAQAFANMLLLSKTAVTNYESGIRKPKRSVVFKIKELAKLNGIEVTIDDLMS